LIAAESQISGLEQIYTDTNVRVRSMKARIASLKDKLSQLRGSTDGSDDPTSTSHNDFDISIAKLPGLGVTYFDLFRRLKIQETVFEILTKQYELAKVEEAKELPTIKVLDVGNAPELKSSPKRTLITVLGGILAALLATAYLIVSFQSQVLDASHPFNLFGYKFREFLSEDIRFLRGHTPKPILGALSSLKARILRRSSSSPPTF
jgi:capsule polysaccharide export protein KpsE/RkpR